MKVYQVSAISKINIVDKSWTSEELTLPQDIVSGKTICDDKYTVKESNEAFEVECTDSGGEIRPQYI